MPTNAYALKTWHYFDETVVISIQDFAFRATSFAFPSSLGLATNQPKTTDFGIHQHRQGDQQGPAWARIGTLAHLRIIFTALDASGLKHQISQLIVKENF